jgi:hypothetical protein
MVIVIVMSAEVTQSATDDGATPGPLPRPLGDWKKGKGGAKEGPFIHSQLRSVKSRAGALGWFEGAGQGLLAERDTGR